ncbi:MAG TPA: hypothetical protein VM532_16720 [Burkholderiales bacterium]|jgi:hypothetical protein|nr:hypothetical protein [Burkholderiales bacterium]
MNADGHVGDDAVDIARPHIPVGPLTKSALRDDREQSSLNYAYQKAQRAPNIPNKAEFLQEIVASIIDTPHPTPPALPTKSHTAHLLTKFTDNFMLRVDHALAARPADADAEVSAEAAKYSDPQTHHDEFQQISQIANLIGVDLSEFLPATVDAYPTDADELRDFSDNLRDAVADSMEEAIDRFGLSTEVISKEQQREDHELKRQVVAAVIGHGVDLSQIKTWMDVDADGNPIPITDYLTSIGVIAADANLDNQSLVDIILQDRRPDTAPQYQTRISFESKGQPDREMPGVDDYLTALQGIAGRPFSVNDLSGEDFEDMYQKMKAAMEHSMPYAPIRYKQPHEDITDVARETLPDFILRSSMLDMHSMVMSDFTDDPAKGEETLAMLHVLQKVSARYLEDKADNAYLPFETRKHLLDRAEKIKQRGFRILAESKEAIEVVPPIMDRFLDAIEAKAGALNGPARDEFLSEFHHDGVAKVGGFNGPSDLTSNDGAVSADYIHDSIGVMATATARSPNIFGQEIRFPVDSGKGQSGRRDKGGHMTGFDGQTAQGPMPAGQEKYEQIPGRRFTFSPSQVFKDASTAEHHHWWRRSSNEAQQGVYVKEWNRICAENPLVAHLASKEVIGTEGQRGKKGINTTYEKQRAISQSYIAAVGGLMSAFLLPAQRNPAGGITGVPIPDFEARMQCPRGAERILNQVYQLGMVDLNRAQQLGFSNEVIQQTADYGRAFSRELARELQIHDRYPDGVDINNFGAKQEFVHAALQACKERTIAVGGENRPLLAPEALSAMDTTQNKLRQVERKRDTVNQALEQYLACGDHHIANHSSGGQRLEFTNPADDHLARDIASHAAIVFDDNLEPPYKVVYSIGNKTLPALEVAPTIEPSWIAIAARRDEGISMHPDEFSQQPFQNLPGRSITNKARTAAHKVGKVVRAVLSSGATNPDIPKQIKQRELRNAEAICGNGNVEENLKPTKVPIDISTETIVYAKRRGSGDFLIGVPASGRTKLRVLSAAQAEGHNLVVGQKVAEAFTVTVDRHGRPVPITPRRGFSRGGGGGE